MPKTAKITYIATVTFDISVGDDTNIYREVSELLEKNKLKKEISGNELPENVYYGSGTAEITYKGERLTNKDIQDKAGMITKRFYKILEDFFKSKKVKFKIFITVSRKETSAIRYTLTKK